MTQSVHKDRKELIDKNIISIDPGKCDLLYCVDGSNNDANTFRYSQENATRQIRKETKSKKYAKINGKTII